MAVKMGQLLKALSTKAEIDTWSPWKKENQLPSAFWSLHVWTDRTKKKQTISKARNQAAL